MPSLEDWRVFVAVANAGSLTGAARQLRLSIPTVSKRLAALEAALEAPLLHRTSRRISLTATGEAVLLRVRSHVDALEEASLALKDHAGPLSGLVRMSAPISFSRLYLAAPLTDFMRRWPQVEIDLRMTDRHLDLIGDSLDLAVRLGNLPDSSMRARRLCDIPMPLVASPAYVADRGVPSSPGDLERHVAIALTQMRQPDRWSFAGASGERRTVEIQRRLGVDNGDVARSAALAGLGLVALPSFFVHDDIQAGRLVELLAPWRIHPIGLHLVTPPAQLRPRRVEALIEHLAEALARQPWRQDPITAGT